MHALHDEMGALTHLRHTGVVSLLHYGVVEDQLITASAHLPGASLAQLCEHFERKQRPFPPHLAIYIVRRLLQTLHHCHTREARGFVHGRVTLGCIHVPASGEPQLMDFGLASLEDVAAEAESQLGFFQTRMSFAAPEITRGESPTARGDTYSLALLLYRLLAGSNPFRGRSIPETLQRVLQLTPAPLVMPAWEHCAQVNAILGRALAKDASVRHQTCLELSDELSGVQIGTYDALAESVATLVGKNATADGRQVARLTRGGRRSRPPRAEGSNSQRGDSRRDDSRRGDSRRGDSRRGESQRGESQRGESQRLAAALPRLESAPAFVTGLLTSKPISVSEQTGRDRELAQLERRRKRRLAMLPTVLLPAAAIILGLFLGRLGGAGTVAVTPRLATPATTDQLVSGSVAALQAHLRECVDPAERREPGAKVELEFGARGQLAEVRLRPSSLAQTRLGACMLNRVWDTGVSAPAALSLVIPLSEAR